MNDKDKATAWLGNWMRSVSPWMWIVIGVVAFGLLAARPASWARPDQAPDYQTVPTVTPTPTSPAQAPTPTPTTRPTDTPIPPRPTNTPVPSQPTATPTPGQPTPTAILPPGPTPTPTATAATMAQPAVLPEQCWTFPTPGFQPERLAAVSFEAESAQFLVVPGQTINLRLTVTNNSSSTAHQVLICNPLDPNVQPNTPVASQGQARLEGQGLIAELGDLPPGATAQVNVELYIPTDYPLGRVIENQAWLFFDGQRASTSLLTWALPPAWLPPVGAPRACSAGPGAHAQ